jgi:hypothetical protein
VVLAGALAVVVKMVEQVVEETLAEVLELAVQPLEQLEVMVFLLAEVVVEVHQMVVQHQLPLAMVEHHHFILAEQALLAQVVLEAVAVAVVEREYWVLAQTELQVLLQVLLVMVVMAVLEAVVVAVVAHQMVHKQAQHHLAVVAASFFTTNS